MGKSQSASGPLPRLLRRRLLPLRWHSDQPEVEELLRRLAWRLARKVDHQL